MDAECCQQYSLISRPTNAPLKRPRKGGAVRESGYETTNNAHWPMLSPLYWIEIQIQMTLHQKELHGYKVFLVTKGWTQNPRKYNMQYWADLQFAKVQSCKYLSAYCVLNVSPAISRNRSSMPARIRIHCVHWKFSIHTHWSLVGPAPDLTTDVWQCCNAVGHLL